MKYSEYIMLEQVLFQDLLIDQTFETDSVEDIEHYYKTLKEEILKKHGNKEKRFVDNM